MTRRRRLMQIVGPWRVSTAIVIGLCVTVLIAYWLALRPGVLPAFPYGRNFNPNHFIARRPLDALDPAVFEATVWTRDEYAHIARSAASTEETLSEWSKGLLNSRERSERPSWIGGISLARRLHPTLAVGWFTEYAYGWPLPAMTEKRAYDVENGQVYEYSSFRVPLGIANRFDLRSDIAPTGFIASGLVLNSLPVSIFVYLFLSLRASNRAHWRRKRGQCRACGYSLEGLTINTCPECNWRIKRKKKNAPSDSARSGPPPPLGTGEESKGS